MKILFISASAQLGGAERMLIDLIASLPPQVNIHLLALSDGPLVADARSLGASVIIAPMPASLAGAGDSGGSLLVALECIPLVLRLRRIVRKIRPDVIHANGIKAQLLSRFIAGDAKVVWHVHDLLEHRAAGKWLRRLSSRTDCVIAVSRAVERDIRAVLPDSRVETVLNAIDIDHFKPGDVLTAQLDRLAGFDHRENAIRIGLVATYARWKGQDEFINACAKSLAATSRPELRFYIIGGPIYSTRGSQFSRTELHELAERAGVLDHVGFIKFQADPVEAYSALDVVVHASTRPEPFGRTVVEAMACERAVIATRGGGIEEIVSDQHDGLIVPPNDPQALADAMLKLSRDPPLRDTLGKAARKTAIEKFDRRRLGPQMLAIYSSLG